MNLEQARINMLKQQIRAWGVLDDTILKLLQTTPREEFVPTDYRKLAFADMNIPLGHGELMLCPKEEARLLQALAVTLNDTVLHIGTGSGYVTALLAQQAKYVYSIDIHADFTAKAKTKLAQLNINNVALHTADAAKGWQIESSYEVIAITGSLPILPEIFKTSLAVGGRLFAIIGQAPVMEALLVTRMTAQEWQIQKLFETLIPPLHNAIPSETFVF